MKGFLLDTNVVVSLIAPAGAPSVKAWAAAQDEQRMYLSVITLAEIDKGIAQLRDDDPKRVRYSESLAAIEARFGPRILPLDPRTVRLWGALSGRIKRDTGHPPPVIDTMLAATALEAALTLATRNIKDVAHTGVVILNPWDLADKPTVHG